MNTTDIVSSSEPRFVIKRSGDKVPFEEDKIKNAIIKATRQKVQGFYGESNHPYLRGKSG